MATLLVSILTPFKNTSEFLADCIESVINQSYTHWELILVNDHSTDNSRAIVEQYADKDDRIIILNNGGQGIIPALRTAIAVSQGKMITRMDSDDLMSPNKIELLSNLLSTYGKGHIAIGQVKYFSENGISDGYARYEKWLNKLTSEGKNFSEIYKECVIPSPNFMVYKDDFLSCGGFQPNRYPEDYDLAFRMYKSGLKCIPCGSVTHYWRDYSTRTSRTHEHYSNNYFLEIKILYFLQINHDPSRPLTLWGAGTKGKYIANFLSKNNIPFYWVCDNPNKIGHRIYHVELLPFEFLSSLHQPQSIVTVANEQSQHKIKKYMTTHKLKPMIDYFFFC